jgi:hypothetical protein
MRKRDRFVGVVVAILIGSLIGLGVQAFSPHPDIEDLPAQINMEDLEQPTFIVPETPYPTAAVGQSSRGAGLVELASPIPFDPPTQEPAPTMEPLEPAPAPAALMANENEIYFNDFQSSELEGWLYGQIDWVEIDAQAWSVLDTETYPQMLYAPPNKGAMNLLNDTMAFPPVVLNHDGAIEVSAMAGIASKVGVVIGFQDEENFIAMIFGAEDAEGMGETGLSLVRVEAGERTTLAHNADFVLERGEWYQLHLEREGDTLRARVNDGKPLAVSLPDGTLDGYAGLYACSSGDAFFDNLRLIEK